MLTQLWGEGSTFFFKLIFDLASQEEVSAVVIEEETDRYTIADDQIVRLLLVEDHKMNQLVARKTLERQYGDSINLTIANNGKEAVDLLAENKDFDIILMDIQMPIMDGYETTRYIRKHYTGPLAGIPILAMTAHAHISKDEKFKEYGMDDFVLKPFKPNQLFSKIAQYTNKD